MNFHITRPCEFLYNTSERLLLLFGYSENTVTLLLLIKLKQQCIFCAIGETDSEPYVETQPLLRAMCYKIHQFLYFIFWERREVVPRVALSKMCFQKFRKTHWNVPTIEFFFSKPADLGTNLQYLINFSCQCKLKEWLSFSR